MPATGGFVSLAGSLDDWSVRDPAGRFSNAQRLVTE